MDWAPSLVQLLGTLPDHSLARRLNLTTNAVAAERARRGIPNFYETFDDAPGIARSTIDRGWEHAKMLPQPQFFHLLMQTHHERTGYGLTYRQLAKMCYVSHSRVQKWSAPGTGQEPLSMQLRHHFWLAVCHQAYSGVQESLLPPLTAGPYEPPLCRAGDQLIDERFGSVLVGGWTNAPIRWPRRKIRGRTTLIFCGDLVRAVAQEKSIAIQRYWDVGPTTVWKWRRAIGRDWR